jgi:hypothetical protein
MKPIKIYIGLDIAISHAGMLRTRNMFHQIYREIRYCSFVFSLQQDKPKK